MVFHWSPWHGRKYFLDKMDLRELVVAYFTYPAIQAYILVAVVSAGAALAWMESPWPLAAAAAAAVLIYPLVWYLLHRYVLHGRLLYHFPQTSALWKRIHFDHHQDPNDLGVLFGALYTTLPTMFIITAPIGWVIGGSSAAAAAFSAALITTCFYEFCHCIQHLPFKPRYEWLRLIKKRHLAHHFHSEKGNYGITNFIWDRLLGTYYESPKRVPRSETVFNLGYYGSDVERFPWVAELSGLSLEEAAAGSLRPRKAS